jgi:hypothetical protein
MNTLTHKVRYMYTYSTTVYFLSSELGLCLLCALAFYFIYDFVHTIKYSELLGGELAAHRNRAPDGPGLPDP